LVHAATAYVVDIDWYYEERTTSTMTPLVVSLVVGLAAVFGLAPLFLLAGQLASASLRRRGPAHFAGSRLLRLGVPLVAFVLVLDPVSDYLGALRRTDHPSLAAYLVDSTGTRDTGPLWFVAVLLVCSLAYAGWRRVRPARPMGPTSMPARTLTLAAAVIAAASFVTWLRWPLDSDAFLNVRWPEWPQGVALFGLGVLAGERGWLDPPSSAQRRRCGQAAGVGAVAFLSYAAYVMHPLVLVALSQAARPLAVAPEVKFLFVAAVGIPAVFAVGYGLTRVPGVSRVV
jgi:glucan biosynthesis protein C